MARERGSHKHKILLQECEDHIYSPAHTHTHLETRRRNFFCHQNISPLSNCAEFSAMSWRRARQPIVCKSCAGIAGGDLICAPCSRSFLLDLCYLPVWEVLKSINNVVISQIPIFRNYELYTSMPPPAFKLHFINYLQTQRVPSSLEEFHIQFQSVYLLIESICSTNWWYTCKWDTTWWFTSQ